MEIWNYFPYNIRMEESDNFAGKTALIVGGTRGTGKEIAFMLRDMGASVYVIGRSSAFKAEDKIHYICSDLEKETFASLKREEILQVINCTDILVYCCGPFLQKTIAQTSAADWEKMAVMNYGLPGAYLSSVLNHQVEQGWGRNVLFGGTRTESVKAYKTNCAYAGAKTGLSVLVKSAAAQYAQYGITVNGICPGFTHDAPENTQNITEMQLAYNVRTLLCRKELNGVLLNADFGWNP